MAKTEPGGPRTRTTVPYQQQLDKEVVVLPLSGCCAGHAGSSCLGLQGGCCRRLSQCWRVSTNTLGRCLLPWGCGSGYDATEVSFPLSATSRRVCETNAKLESGMMVCRLAETSRATVSRTGKIGGEWVHKTRSVQPPAGPDQ